jgi:hypothetical protein
MGEHEDIIKTPNTDSNIELYTIFKEMSETLQTLSDNTQKLKKIADRVKKRLEDKRLHSQHCPSQVKP